VEVAVEAYTIGFTHKSAEQFFGTLGKAGIRRLVDVRCNNTSQLAGFSKRDDLRYFLRELCGIEYVHEPALAPTADLLASYRKKELGWHAYEQRFLELLAARRVEGNIDRGLFDVPTALLCSEETAERCHRRLALEYLGRHWGDLTVVHL
jgi:uncharacterized protein (DUF488 family)